LSRWKRGLVIAGASLVGLAVLVALLAPTVVAAVAKSKIQSVLAEKLQAEVTVGGVSFRWSGRVSVEAVRIVPRGFSEPLLDVERADADVDLLAAAGGKILARVVVAAPKLLIEKNAAGTFNYEFPPGPTRPPRPPDGEPSEPPEVRVTLAVRGGRVVLRSGGRETEYVNLSADATLDTLRKPLEYSLSLEGRAGDRLQARGSFDLERMSGPATLVLHDVSLKNLAGAARAYSPILELDGRANGVLEYRMDGKLRFGGKAQLDVAGLEAAILGGRALRLDRLTFTHEGGLDEKGDGRHTFVLASGPAFGGTLTADLKDAFGARAVRAELKFDSDLAALGKILRPLGCLPAGSDLAGAASLRGTVESRGPTDADLRAGNLLPETSSWAVTLTAVQPGLSLDGKPMKLDRVDVVDRGTLDARGNAKSTITLTSGKAIAATAEVEAANVLSPARSLRARLKADSDLGELGKALEKLVGIKPGMTLEGKAAVSGTVETHGADVVKADLDLKASDVVAVETAPKKRHELDRAISAKLVGGWNGATKRASADVAKLESSFATLDARGGVALGGKAPEIQPSKLTLEADLEKLAEKLKSFMEAPPALGGKASLSASAEGERLSARGTFRGARFGAYGPLDATLTHEGTLDASGSGRHTVKLEAGKALDLRLGVGLKDAFGDRRSVEATVEARSDVGALAALAPGLISVKAGTEPAGSAVLTGEVKTKGADAVAFKATLAASDLASVEKASRRRREVEKSLAASLAGEWDGKKKALDLQAASVEASFGKADARGAFALGGRPEVKGLALQVARLDLEKLGAVLALVRENSPALAGTVKANATFSGDRFTSTAEAQGVKVVTPGRTIGPLDARLEQRGTFSKGDLKIELCELVSKAATAKLSGGVARVTEESRAGGLKLEAALKPEELSKWLPGLGLGGPEIRVEAALEAKDGRTTVSGKTKLDGLTWTVKDEKGQAVTKTAKSGPLEFAVAVRGKDVEATARTPLFEWLEKAYAAKGGLDARVTYGEKGSTGTTKIANLEVVDEKKNTIREPEVTVVHDVAFGSVDIRKLEVTSGFLKGTVRGKILDRDGKKVFEGLEGRFTYLPDRLGAVLAPWLPGTLEGAEERSVSVTLNGEAKVDDVLSVLRGTRGQADLDLAKFTTEGVSVSGRTKLVLEGGRLSASTPLDVNRGKTELTGSIDFRDKREQPQSVLDFRAREVAANANMGPLLESINPIFHTYNGTVDGKITSDFRLVWRGPVDPASKDLKKDAAEYMTGSGVLAVKDLSITGSPAVREIMKALGEGNAIQGELVATDVRVGRGRCEYSNMTLRLKRYELRFSGWVDFYDETGKDKKYMHLMVEMPMTDGIVRRYPNLQKYLGKTFFVPLEGTVDSPRFDFDGAIAELAKRALEGVVQDKLEDALRRLLERRKK
jgi:hypothetical protein